LNNTNQHTSNISFLSIILKFFFFRFELYPTSIAFQEVAKNAGGASVQNKLDSDPALLTVDDINALAAAVNWCDQLPE